MYTLGAPVRYINTPTQKGKVTRLYPLGCKDAIVVTWFAGSMHQAGTMMAYFGSQMDLLGDGG